MSFSFGSWCSWTKQESWVNIRCIFLFLVLIRWNEEGRWVTLAVWELPVTYYELDGIIWCVWSVCRWLSQWWFWGLMLLRVMGVGFDNICTVSRKWNFSRVIPRLYGWVNKTLRLSPLVVDHNAVVMSARLNPIGGQFLILVLWNLCSKSVGGLKCWDPVESSDNGSLSSITLRMEYLLAFQYWYCELCVENWWRRGRKHCFVNFCSLAVLESSVDERW